jgi:uncharacterized protein (DUF433 family)
MTLPEFLTREASGEIRFTGHRIGLFHLVHYYNEGHSPEMLVTQYPTLSLALVHKAIAFYLDNRAEVDGYVAACRTELDQQRVANPRRIDAETLRARLEAMQQTEKT